jgi:hypothetical protein
MAHEGNDILFLFQELTSLGVNFEDEEVIALEPLVDIPIDQEIILDNNYALPAAAAPPPPPPPPTLPLADDEIRVRVETAIENVEAMASARVVGRRRSLWGVLMEGPHNFALV